MQIISFSIIGALTTGLDFFLLIVLTEIISIPYYISNILSFSISLILNYFLSMRFVFKIKNSQSVIKNAFSFFLLSTTGLVINQLILMISTQCIGIFYIYSKVISTAIVMVWNFVTKKLYFEYNM